MNTPTRAEIISAAAGYFNMSPHTIERILGSENEACAIVCETQSGGGSYQIRAMLAKAIRMRIFK